MRRAQFNRRRRSGALQRRDGPRCRTRSSPASSAPPRPRERPRCSRRAPRYRRKRGLAVYRDAYPTRLCRGLRQNFPALHHVLGEAEFTALIAAYVAAHPPRGYEFAPHRGAARRIHSDPPLRRRLRRRARGAGRHRRPRAGRARGRRRTRRRPAAGGRGPRRGAARGVAGPARARHGGAATGALRYDVLPVIEAVAGGAFAGTAGDRRQRLSGVSPDGRDPPRATVRHRGGGAPSSARRGDDRAGMRRRRARGRRHRRRAPGGAGLVARFGVSTRLRKSKPLHRSRGRLRRRDQGGGVGVDGASQRAISASPAASRMASENSYTLGANR